MEISASSTLIKWILSPNNSFFKKKYFFLKMDDSIFGAKAEI